MFIKCLLLLSVLSFIDARYPTYSYKSCQMPSLDNGRVRSKPRTKLIKFICNSAYALVGNRYATCRTNGLWDVPTPVCVRSGCLPLPEVPKSIQISTNDEAWFHFWCYSGYKLIGSPVTYCNGTHWSTAVPTCINTKIENQLRCDFEDPNICGWTQDEMHDFDWTRFNMQTPSSFHFTGPSYDHTFGEGGSGYYMYIESTSKQENDTARLLSPIYDAMYAYNGCFSFYYHMFGGSVGGLRVYQKPDSLPLFTMLNLSENEKQKYILFEKWGNQDNAWYSAAPQLRNLSDSFQIVIEGIRGNGFTSDIAIDDVAILQGDNCTAAQKFATTPATSYSMDSCAGRCDISEPASRHCGCNSECLFNHNCCPDYAELCFYDSETSKSDADPILTNSSIEMPQTEKLVANTDTTSTTTTGTPSTSTTTRTPSTSTTTTTPSTSTTTTTPRTTISTTTTTTTTTTIRPIKRTSTTKLIDKPVPTVKDKNTTLPKPFSNETQTKPKEVSTPRVAPKITPIPTVTTTSLPSTITNRKITKPDLIEQKKKSKEVKIQNGGEKKPVENKSSLKTAVIVIVVLVLCACGVWVGAAARTARGRAALARLRARTTNDSEVRYLHADDDDL